MNSINFILFLVFVAGIALAIKVYNLDRKGSIYKLTAVSLFLNAILTFIEYEMIRVEAVSDLLPLESLHTTVITTSIYLFLISIWLFTDPIRRSKNKKAEWVLFTLYTSVAVIFYGFMFLTDIGFTENQRFEKGLWFFNLKGSHHWHMKVHYFFFLISYLAINFCTYQFYQKSKTPKSKNKNRSLAFLMIIVSTAMVVLFLFRGKENTTSAYLMSPFLLLGALIFIEALFKFRLFVLSPITAIDNILNSMSDLTAITDINFNVKYMNHQARNDFGIGSGSLEGLSFQSIAAIFGVNKWDEIQKEVEVLQANENYQDDFAFSFYLTRLYYRINFTPIFNKSGVKQGYVAVGQNITESVEAESKLKLSNQKLTESNEELERFAFIASHDLKTPLRNISGFLSLIKRRIKDQDDSKLDEYIQIAINSSNQMYHLIQDVLEYSKVSKDDTQINSELVNLNDIIGNIKQSLSPMLEKKKAVIYSDKLPSIKGDKIRFFQLFLNMIENGLKYNNSIRPTVYVGYRKINHGHQFQIKDNGIGIEKEYFDKVFEMFKRLHTSNQYEGSGIGLAICKKIVSQYSGSIQLTSSKDQGSCFTFTLFTDSKTEATRISKPQAEFKDESPAPVMPPVVPTKRD